MADKIYEIAILGRVSWNFHSLNNEGTVGNVTEPRTIVLPDGSKTDGVSGEMLKHIHAYYLWQLISNKTNFLCQICRELNPEKANANPEVRGAGDPTQAVATALKCYLCDLHGFLVERPTVSRSSVIEFGWAVGLPQIYRDTHVHIRYSPQQAFLAIEEEREPGEWGKESCSQKGCETSPEESKLYKVKNKWYCEEHLPTRAVQMVYHRPTRSGVYGIVSVFQPWRIGFNDVSCQYVQGINRADRYKLALEAYIALFLRTEGAMTTTRLPHTQGFEGVVVYTTQNFPVPVLSPLKETYIDEIKDITGRVNAIAEEFNSLDKFVEIIKGLEGKEPWSG